MTQKSTNKTLGLLLALIFLFGALLFIPLACAANHSAIGSMLDSGTTVNKKILALASGTGSEETDNKPEIKAIRMAESLPDDFIPSDANTVSTRDSKYPIYIFFDNKDDAGIMYFYTESNTIVMSPYSGFMFAYNTALTDISGLSGWDSSNVVHMDGLFYGAKSLADISSFKDWDTSNVTNMHALFCNARSLPDALAIKNWNTSNVTDMGYMFSSAVSLTLVDVSNWSTSKVKNMACMFQVGDSWKANGQLIEINGLGDLDVSNVKDMTCMFYGASKMTYYDVSRWNVSKVESMNHMFCDNRSLLSLDLSNWDVSSLKTVYCMFDDNVSLKTIGDVSHWNTVSLIDAGGWLNECSSFVGDNQGTLDLSGWNTSSLKAAGEMFLRTQIHTIDLSGWTFDSITNDKWEGTGQGIYYETGNNAESYMGLGGMFHGVKTLKIVYVSQSGLDSYNAAVEREVNTLDMWKGTIANGFTVK